MFTISQLKAAHAKVKSGADFPRYIQEIKEFGVMQYTTFVADGHTIFQGADGQEAVGEPKYAPLKVAGGAATEAFQRELKAHQQGKSDYLTFCRQSAAAGVHLWRVDLVDLTCTYLDTQGREMLVEQIPA